MKKINFILFLVLFYVVGIDTYAEVLSISQIANVTPQPLISNPARGGLAYNGEFYLYLSPDRLNTIAYKSTDGMTWTKKNAFINYTNHGSSVGNVTRLIWDGKQFVATCRAGIITSIDGFNWTEKTPDLWKNDKFNGSDIIFTGRSYAITGYLTPKMGGITFISPTFLYSEDLENYTIAKTANLTRDAFGTERSFDDLLYANNKLFALGSQTIASSSDGKEWTGYVCRSSVISDPVEPSGNTIWDGEKYITATSAGIYYSKDTKVWTPACIIKSPASEKIYLRCIAYNGTDYIASGESYDNSLIYYYSKDGKKWDKKVHSGTKANITTLYPTNAGFLAGGSSLYNIVTRKTGTLSSWSQNTVKEAISKEIYDYNIAPYYQGAAKRVDVAQLIANAYEYVKQTEIVYSNAIHFTDTQDSAILKVAQLKLMNGLTTNCFGPNDTLTKEQISVILANLANQLNIRLATSKYTIISDLSKAGAWAKPSIEIMVNSGIMSLDQNKNFNPKSEVSIEQAIVLVMNIVNRA